MNPLSFDSTCNCAGLNAVVKVQVHKQVQFDHLYPVWPDIQRHPLLPPDPLEQRQVLVGQ